MTQEEKQLLLKDLCARLPHGIKCTTKLTGYNDVYVVQGVYVDNVFINCPVYEEGDDEWMVESIIPYLRPMSSMTEEEKEYMEELSTFKCTPDKAQMKIDFYLKNHIDYRGLIKKGLALEAHEGMYNTKTK